MNLLSFHVLVLLLVVIELEILWSEQQCYENRNAVSSFPFVVDKPSICDFRIAPRKDQRVELAAREVFGFCMFHDYSDVDAQKMFQWEESYNAPSLEPDFYFQQDQLGTMAVAVLELIV